MKKNKSFLHTPGLILAHWLTNPVIKAVLVLFAIGGTLLPMASKQSLGATIPALFKFKNVSNPSALTPMLYIVAILLAMLVVLEISKVVRNLNLSRWYLNLSVVGIVMTIITVAEGIAHIEIYGALCTVIPELLTATGPTLPGSGGILLLLTYIVLAVIGIKGLRNSEMQQTKVIA